MKIAVLGLGEAGCHFANDLVEMGYHVSGWDPNLQRDLYKTVRFASSNQDAAAEADIIFNVNLSSISEQVAEEVKPVVHSNAIFCEMNTSSPNQKIRIEKILERSCHVVDVAIMAPVPLQGIRTPLLVSGKASKRLNMALSKLDNIESIAGEVGEAATLKLLRSIVYKGIAAVICEAMEAADYFNKEKYMRKQIASIIGDNDDLVNRFINGSRQHAVRRLHEMEAVEHMLSSSDLSAVMSNGAIQNLSRYSKNKNL